MLPTAQTQAAGEAEEWSSMTMGSAPHSYARHCPQEQSDLTYTTTLPGLCYYH